MNASLDFSVLNQKDTWKAFGIGIVLFCIIGFASLSLFGLSTSVYGVSDQVEPVPDFIAQTMNRTGVDDTVPLDNGSLQLSDLRGNVVILDFMAIDCANCHYVQEHINQNIESWQKLEGDYSVIVVSIASWYDYETFEQINSEENPISFLSLLADEIAPGLKSTPVTIAPFFSRLNVSIPK